MRALLASTVCDVNSFQPDRKHQSKQYQYTASVQRSLIMHHGTSLQVHQSGRLELPTPLVASLSPCLCAASPLQTHTCSHAVTNYASGLGRIAREVPKVYAQSRIED